MKNKKKDLAASDGAGVHSQERRGETYTSVSRHGLQKAFALAHRLSENEFVPNAQRAQFRAIAYLIWKAHGEPGTPPDGSGEILWETMSAWDNGATARPSAPDLSAQSSPKPKVSDCDKLRYKP